MKNLKKHFLIISLTIINTLIAISYQSCTTVTEEIDTQEEVVSLTQDEKDMLIKMREEEKLARDVYDYLYLKYGDTLDIFNWISNSEQFHMNNVLEVLVKYDIPDPALSEPGQFNAPQLQDLYEQLTAAGDVSVIDALKVGATIEDLDIYDLEEYLNQTDNEDIVELFSSLACWSRNHMRSFVSELNLYTENYSPQFISQTEFDDIIYNAYENCF